MQKVDGGWGEWASWNECDAPCDGGNQTRTRKCDKPEPAFGGDGCKGESTETRECNTLPCPGLKRSL